MTKIKGFIGRQSIANVMLLVMTILSLAQPPLVSCATNTYPISDHFDGEKFYSPRSIEHLSFGQVLGHILFGRNGDWPSSVEVINNNVIRQNSDCINVTWIGHASTLVQIDGINILTDPVWSERVGPVPLFGAKRVSPPGIDFDALPKIDLVVISHNHYDHLDLPPLSMLEEKFHPTFVVPLGMEQILESQNLTHIYALDWWGEYRFNESVHVFLTPSQHNSGRGLFDRDQSLWGSYLIQSEGKKVYFAGDTAWGNHFEQIYDRFGPIDVALLPIGAYKPEEQMSRYHISPLEAVKAANALHAELSVPIHYDTFQLTAEDYGQPLKDLDTALMDVSASRPRFAPLKVGGSYCHGMSSKAH